jgi:predicted transcriptional regulator of viral defense system
MVQSSLKNMQKPIDKIKHGPKVLAAMEEEALFFVEDIRRATGLDEKTLRGVLDRLSKNRYLYKDHRGQWCRTSDKM